MRKITSCSILSEMRYAALQPAHATNAVRSPNMEYARRHEEWMAPGEAQRPLLLLSDDGHSRGLHLATDQGRHRGRTTQADQINLQLGPVPHRAKPHARLRPGTNAT